MQFRASRLCWLSHVGGDAGASGYAGPGVRLRPEPLSGLGPFG